MYAKEMEERLENGEDALELSIEKWKDIINHLFSIEHFWEFNKALEVANANCALCKVHRSEISSPDDCKHCPVFLFTRKRYCHGTPYSQFNKSLENPIGEIRKVARKELEFLKSLRNHETD